MLYNRRGAIRSMGADAYEAGLRIKADNESTDALKLARETVTKYFGKSETDSWGNDAGFPKPQTVHEERRWELAMHHLEQRENQLRQLMSK